MIANQTWNFYGPTFHQCNVAIDVLPAQHQLQQRTFETGCVFYRRPSPDEAPFKSEGDVLSIGDTVGVIEAMKSFFPLEVETAGRLVRFLVKDGTEIEAGDILAEIEG